MTDDLADHFIAQDAHGNDGLWRWDDERPWVPFEAQPLHTIDVAVRAHLRATLPHLSFDQIEAQSDARFEAHLSATYPLGNQCWVDGDVTRIESAS